MTRGRRAEAHETGLTDESTTPTPLIGETIKVRAVYGRMIDSGTQTWFDTEGLVEVEGPIREGSWLDVQIKAGKLQVETE